MTDYLIIGAGTAGCVLANRLSAAGAHVHVVEAGPDIPPGAVPRDVADLYPRSYYNGRYMWPGLTADQSGDGSGRASGYLQARVMGGGSSVMGMIASRGQPSDYDGWAAAGAAGWSWEEVLPYFRRLEHDRDFGGPLHGADGPIPIRRHHPEDWPPLCAAMAGAVAARGWGVVEDMNGTFADGYCRLPLSATLAARVSAADAYLDRDVRRRPNLAIECGATVERLLFEGGRCVGARVATAGGAVQERRAARTVVAAGAIHSPALLQRSGVGPEPLLASLGIPLVAASNGVGENLQNHPVAYLVAHLRPAARQPAQLRPQFNTGLRYSSGAAREERGDMMLYVLNRSSWHGVGADVGGIGVSLLAPRSRGTVRIVSADPRTPPQVRFRMLSAPRDFERMAAGLRLAVELMGDERIVPLRNELFATGYSRVVRNLNRPGPLNVAATRLLAAVLDGPDVVRRTLIKHGIAGGDVDERRMSQPAWIEETVRRLTFGTYHPAGSCRIGPDGDALAVLDERCSVRGVERLSVVDASVMPALVRANTNIPVAMVAERAADLLLDDDSR